MVFQEKVFNRKVRLLLKTFFVKILECMREYNNARPRCLKGSGGFVLERMGKWSHERRRYLPSEEFVLYLQDIWKVNKIK